MSLVLNSSGGGSVTLSEPTTASNFTLTLPAANGTALADSTVGVCRAWVNFNGSGTVAIRAAFNVSSITDNAAGDYTVNFTTAMVDANYSVISSSEGGGSAGNPPYQRGNYPITSASNIRLTFLTFNAGSFVDPTYCCAAVFR